MTSAPGAATFAAAVLLRLSRGIDRMMSKRGEKSGPADGKVSASIINENNIQSKSRLLVSSFLQTLSTIDQSL